MKLIFHHIPKAGGTSVLHSLRQVHKHKRIAFASNVSNIKIGNGFYSSHYYFKDYEGDGLYFTWIRNPVDMFYSAFSYYSQPNKPHPLYKPEATRAWLADAVKHPTLEAYVDAALDENHVDTFPRGLLDLNWDRFDFVGVTERMRSSLAAFSDLVGATLPIKHSNRSSGAKDYRRDEVEAMLSDQMEIYDEQRKQAQAAFHI